MGLTSLAEDIEERADDERHLAGEGASSARSVWWPVRVWKALAAKFEEHFWPITDQPDPSPEPPAQGRGDSKFVRRRPKRRRRVVGRRAIPRLKPGQIVPVLSAREEAYVAKTGRRPSELKDLHRGRRHRGKKKKPR